METTIFEEINGVSLDPDFFTSDGQLLDDISAVLQNVTQDLLSGLAEKGFSFEPSGTILTGSLTGPNWDDQSDVDLHILLDYNQFDKEEVELWKEFLRLYAKNFNEKGYTLAGRDIEVYFQDVKEPHSSPAVYDVLRNKWIAEPNLENEEVLEPKSLKVVDKFVDEIDKLEEEEKDTKDYNKFLDKLHTVFDNIKDMRKEGMKKEGFKSQENLVFKKLRRNGAINKLVNLILKTQNKVYSVVR